MTFNRKLEEKGGKWGTTVLSRSSAYSPYMPGEAEELLNSIKGSCALLMPNNPHDPWLGSIHSNHQILPENIAELGRKAGVLKESKWEKYREIEIFAHDFKRIADDANFVVSGDLNLSLLWDKSTGKNTSENIFANLNILGFHRLGPLEIESEMQT